MTKVKICGITRAEDARFCAEMGVDFLGFIFVRASPRYVEPGKAAELRSAAVPAAGPAASSPPLRGVAARDAARPAGEDAGVPLVVGVFRDESPAEIRRIAQLVNLDYIQLHGSESDADIRAIGLPTIKAFRVENEVPDANTEADWLMFDSGGGTGRVFDWSLLASVPRTKPFFLAGGLNPDNIEEAIRVVRPDAIDLSSGVELAPGVKDHDKIRKLMERVK
jgi:phosphoribosylanthranilate isomerase